MASLSGAIKFYLFLEMLNKNEIKDPQDCFILRTVNEEVTENQTTNYLNSNESDYSKLLDRDLTSIDYEKLQACVKQTFENWEFFIQVELLDNCITRYPEDTPLINASIDALTETLEERDHGIHKKLLDRLELIKQRVQKNPLKRTQSAPAEFFNSTFVKNKKVRVS